MIDIENEVITILKNELALTFSNIFISGEYISKPPEFPCVSVVQIDNQVYRNTRTSSVTENHAQVVYEISVYSNKSAGKKSECKSIMNVVDKKMEKLGFTRFMLSPLPNTDGNIYRLVARYRAIVSKDKTIYRR